MKKQILAWVKQYDKLVAEYIKQGDKQHFIPMPKADALQKKVMGFMKENFDALDVDFVLEVMTKFGFAPSLVYDDNGHWAVTGDGTQPVVTGKQRLTGVTWYSFHFARKQWFSSIRAAVKFYVEKKQERY